MHRIRLLSPYKTVNKLLRSAAIFWGACIAGLLSGCEAQHTPVTAETVASVLIQPNAESVAWLATIESIQYSDSVVEPVIRYALDHPQKFSALLNRIYPFPHQQLTGAIAHYATASGKSFLLLEQFDTDESPAIAHLVREISRREQHDGRIKVSNYDRAKSNVLSRVAQIRAVTDTLNWDGRRHAGCYQGMRLGVCDRSA